MARVAEETVIEATKPGWRPSYAQAFLKAPSGYTARWVRNEAGNIQRKLAEGWKMMRPEDNKGAPIIAQDTTEANALASEIRHRDMIAMMMPVEMKEQRTAYYQAETQRLTSAVFDKTDQEFKKNGVATYAPKGMKGRIVID